MQLDESAYAILRHWINEREKVRLLKESGAPRPWTQDAIIHTWRFAHLRGAPDWDTFILPGPGTQRGLNRLHAQPLAKKWLPEEASAPDFAQAYRNRRSAVHRDRGT